MEKKKGRFVSFIGSLRYFFVWRGMVWPHIQQLNVPCTEVLRIVQPGLLHRNAFFAEVQC